MDMDRGMDISQPTTSSISTPELSHRVSGEDAVAFDDTSNSSSSLAKKITVECVKQSKAKVDEMK